jgi:hypothetical protein
MSSPNHHHAEHVQESSGEHIFSPEAFTNEMYDLTRENGLGMFEALPEIIQDFFADEEAPKHIH